MARTVKNLTLPLLGYALSYSAAFADEAAGIFDGPTGGVTGNDLRNGNITFATIPKMILAATNFFLGLAGTVSVVMILPPLATPPHPFSGTATGLSRSPPERMDGRALSGA